MPSNLNKVYPIAWKQSTNHISTSWCYLTLSPPPTIGTATSLFSILLQGWLVQNVALQASTPDHPTHCMNLFISSRLNYTTRWRKASWKDFMMTTSHCPWVSLFLPTLWPTKVILSWIGAFKIGPLGTPLTGEDEWFNVKHSSTRMCVEPGFDNLEAKFKEDGGKSSLNLDFIPMVVHLCCILHNILLVSKYRTLDQILRDCHLPAMDDDWTWRRRTCLRVITTSEHGH